MSKSTLPTRKGCTTCHYPKPSTAASPSSTVPTRKGCTTCHSPKPSTAASPSSTVPTRKGRTACHSLKPSTAASPLSSAQYTVQAPESDTLLASRKARSPCLSHMSKPTVPTSHADCQSLKTSTAACPSSSVGDPKANTKCTSGRTAASTAASVAPKASFRSSYFKSPGCVTFLNATLEAIRLDNESQTELDGRGASCKTADFTTAGKAPKASFGSSYSKSPDWVTSVKATPETTNSDNALPTELDDQEKESVYLLYEGDPSEPFCLNWHTFNRKERKATTLEISPSLSTQPSIEINANASAVALGSLIYILGGSCGNMEVCYEGIRGAHAHTSVYYFDTIRPKDGWQQVAPMNSARILPTAVAVDGKIFVIGDVFPSWSKTMPNAEIYDPKTNQWEPLPESPYFNGPPRDNMQAAVHIVDPNDSNQTRILFQPDFNSLHSFNLFDNSWSVIDEDFDFWDNSGAVLDNILYIFSRKTKLLHGYDLINNTRLPVEFRELAGLEIETAAVHNVGNGKLCLLFHGYECFRGLKIVCVTFKVKKGMYYGDKPRQLTAIEVSGSSFDISDQIFWNLLVL